MGISKQLSLGWQTYSEAHQFIRQHGLYKLFLVPVFLNIVLFSLMVWLGIAWAGSFTDTIYSWLALDQANWGSFNWLTEIIYWTLSLLLGAIVFLLYLSIFRYIMLILIAPVLAYVSEKTEELATGNSYPFSLPQLLKDTWRGIQIAIRNGLTEVLLTIILLLASFIPVAGFVTPVLLFLVQSYFYGFSMMDYYFERQKLSANESRNLILRYKWTAIGNGSFFNGMLYLITLLSATLPLVLALLAKFLFIIPVLFLSILPIYSVVAGTLAALKINQKPN